MNNLSLDAATLRRQLRKNRRALSSQAQQQAALNLYKTLFHSKLFRQARHIGFYLANDGEIDPKLLIKAASKLNKKIYLPVLLKWPKNHMVFQQITPSTQWQFNKYHIKEPKPNRALQPKTSRLDLIFMPLVGFDSNGGRLGMGGGFYDRHLSYLMQRRHWQKPLLVGLAHACQQVDKLPLNAWDIPLSMTVTDKHIIHAQKNK